MKATFASLPLLAAVAISVAAAAVLYGQAPAPVAPPSETAPAAAPALPSTPQAVRPPVLPVQATQTLAAPASPGFAANLPESEFKVFSLVNARASESVQQIIPFFKGRMVADDRTNQIIASGSKGDLAIVEALLMKLDVPGREIKPSVPTASSLDRRSVTSSASSGSSDPIRSWATAKMNELDQNKNGKLDRDELSNLNNGQRYDRNSDGTVTLEEMVEAQKNWRPGEESGGAGIDKPRAVGGTVGGGGRGGMGGMPPFGGGGFQGTFGAAGAGVGSDLSLFNPKAISPEASAELTKALREAEANATEADAEAKHMADLLKQIEGMTNKTDESAKAYAQLRKALEFQRQLSEKQRRAVENASRAAEAAGRNAGASLFKLAPDAGQADLARLKAQREVLAAFRNAKLQSAKVAAESGRLDEAARFQAEHDALEAQEVELSKREADANQLLATVKKQVKQPTQIDSHLNKQLAEYKKLLSGKLSDEQKTRAAELKDQLKATLDKQFEESQKSHSDELKHMRERLEKLEKEMSDRTKNRSEIINRRLDELLAAKSANAILTIQGSSLDAVGALPKILKLPGNTTGVRRTRTLEDGTVVIEEQIRQQPGARKVDPNDDPFGNSTPAAPKLEPNGNPLGDSGVDLPKPAPDDDPFR